MAKSVSENADWLSVLSYSTIVAYPLAIQTAAKLNVFEILEKHGPLSAQQITQHIPRTVSNPRASLMLDRLLHLLCSPSLSAARPLLAASLSPPSTLLYSLLPPAKFFLSDVQGGSMGEYMSTRVLNFLNTYQHLDSVIVDGGDGFHKEFGHKVSHHVAHHADQLEGVMAKMTSMFMGQFLDVYDGFKDIGTLVDVGGSTGTTLVHALDKYPHLQGINFDQPHIVVKGITHPRLQHVGGNMLESIPPTNAAMLKLVLHDWEDDECVTILTNCKKAITSESGKVVVVEFHLPELVDGTAPRHHFDIIMMASHGGKLRTVADYKHLGQAAGFSDMNLACLVNEYCILEFLL